MPLDRRARLVVDLGAERLERLLQVPDLLLRLLRVVPELLLELRALGGGLELAQHVEHRLLHRQRGAELVREELSRALDRLEHVDPFRRCREPGGYPTSARRNRHRTGALVSRSDAANVLRWGLWRRSRESKRERLHKPSSSI